MTGRGIKYLAILTLLTLTSAMVFGEDGISSKSAAFDKVRITQLKQAEPNLNGSGITIAVLARSNTYQQGKPTNDYRPKINHNSLLNKEFTFEEMNFGKVGESAHTTAICSILFGNDENARFSSLGKFKFEGITPKAEAEVYEFWHFLSDDIFPQDIGKVDVISASIGSQFEDWWARGIEALTEKTGVIVVAGIGNGSKAYDVPLYPAAGSNVIAVGVLDSVKSEKNHASTSNFALPNPDHTSTGPTDKGICKPDILAVGNCIVADSNKENAYKMSGNWTSFSTPVVAGTVGLLLQKAHQDSQLQKYFTKPNKNSLIKAILLTSAQKLPYWHKGRLTKTDDANYPLDFIQGSGLLDAFNAYNLLTAGNKEPSSTSSHGWNANTISKKGYEQKIYKISLPADESGFITSTLVWDKHFNSSYPFASLDKKNANLRLELWAVDYNAPNRDYLADYSDSKSDYLEHLYYKVDPNYTNYELIVSYSENNVSDSNSENYAVTWMVNQVADANDVRWYDLNSDGSVNELDLLVMAQNTVKSYKPDGPYLYGDINNDGVIDLKDMQLLIAQLGTKTDWAK